jgi:hypothetical protein
MISSSEERGNIKTMRAATTPNYSGVAQLPVANPKKAAEFITDIWHDQPGKYFFLDCAEPDATPTGGESFSRGEFDKIEDYIRSNRHLSLWWCPGGYSKRRRKGNAVEPKWLYADLDYVNIDKLRVKPTIAIQTSPKKYVGLWLMNKPASFELNKRLSYACAQDKTGHARAKYLRLPFSINRKPKYDSPLVKVLWDNGPKYTLASIEEALGPWATVSMRTLAAIRRRPQKERSAEDRSTQLFHIMRSLIEEGFNDGDIVALVADSYWNKWENNEDRLREDIERARSVGGNERTRKAEKRVKPEYFDLHELKNKKLAPTRWIVPGVMPEGLGILGGRPKKGKSWLTLDWAYAVATGGKAFGEIECKAGDVLWLPLEDNEKRLKKRTRKYLKGRPWPERVRVSLTFPRLGAGCEEEIRKWAASKERPRLVIIDTLKKVKPRRDKDSSYDTDSDDLEGLQKLAGELGITILLIHHTRKMTAEDPFDTLLGSTGLTATPDFLMALLRDRGSNDAQFLNTGRDIEEELHKAIQFDDGRWLMLGDFEQDSAVTDAETFLRDLLKDGPMKKKDIEQHARGRNISTEGALRRAREKICDKPYRKDDAWWWELRASCA